MQGRKGKDLQAASRVAYHRLGISQNCDSLFRVLLIRRVLLMRRVAFQGSFFKEIPNSLCSRCGIRIFPAATVARMRSLSVHLPALRCVRCLQRVQAMPTHHPIHVCDHPFNNATLVLFEQHVAFSTLTRPTLHLQSSVPTHCCWHPAHPDPLPKGTPASCAHFIFKLVTVMQGSVDEHFRRLPMHCANLASPGTQLAKTR